MSIERLWVASQSILAIERILRSLGRCSVDTIVQNLDKQVLGFENLSPILRERLVLDIISMMEASVVLPVRNPKLGKGLMYEVNPDLDPDIVHRWFSSIASEVVVAVARSLRFLGQSSTDTIVGDLDARVYGFRSLELLDRRNLVNSAIVILFNLDLIDRESLGGGKVAWNLRL
jgi:hypothetical protein